MSNIIVFKRRVEKNANNNSVYPCITSAPLAFGLENIIAVVLRVTQVYVSEQNALSDTLSKTPYKVS